MAHPGLALLGALALGLIGAGVWLRMEGARPPAPPPLDLPLAPPPAAEPEGGENPAVQDPGPAPEPAAAAPEAAEPQAAPERPAEPAAAVPLRTEPDAPGTGPVLLRAPQPGGVLITPEAVRPVPPAEPAPATGKPGPDPAETAADGRAPAFIPATYTGPAVWQAAPGAAITPVQLAQARDIARAAGGGSEYFGAMAVSPANGGAPASQFFAQGFASLAMAEDRALRLCAQSRAECRIAAHLVPGDFDGARDGTLTAHQAQVWDIAQQDIGAARQVPVAFAWSPDGGAGYSVGATPPRGETLALARCQDDRRRLGRRDADPDLACRIAP